MERFVPSFRGRPWRDGARALHVYAVPDLTVDQDLARLVGGVRAATKDFPILPPEDQYLHLTLDVVAADTAQNITDGQRTDLIGALLTSMAQFDAFTLTLGSPRAGRAGVLLDVSPDRDVDALRRVIRSAIQATVPSDYTYPVAPVHMSLGYNYDTGDSDRLQSALRRIRPGHARMTVGSVQLVDVLFRTISPEGCPTGEGEAWDLSWDHLATIPLRNRPC
jgi:hypothetical protein